MRLQRVAAFPAPARARQPLRAASTCRADARWRRRRWVAASASPPEPLPPPDPAGPPAPSLGARALSLPEAVTRAYSSLCDKLAAEHEVRHASEACKCAGLRAGMCCPKRPPAPGDGNGCKAAAAAAGAPCVTSRQSPARLPGCGPSSRLLLPCHPPLQKRGKSARTAVRAFLGGPGWWVSREDLEHWAFMAECERRTAEHLRKCEEHRQNIERRRAAREKEQRGKASPRPKPAAGPSSPPPPPAPTPRPAPLVWPSASDGAAPAMANARMAAAEASAAAAAAWARTAAAREAAAEAAAESSDGQPAAQHTGGAEGWEWAAAAWHAAYQALDTARQACPDSPAVRDAEAAVNTARALKAQRQALRNS